MKETFIVFIAFVIGMSCLIDKGGEASAFNERNDDCFGDDSEPGDNEQFDVEVVG